MWRFDREPPQIAGGWSWSRDDEGRLVLLRPDGTVCEPLSALSVSETAALRGVSRQRVLAVLKSGKVKGAVMIAGRWLVAAWAAVGARRPGTGKRGDFPETSA